MSPLPPSPFITNPVMPTTGPAVAFSEPSGSAATAALIPASTGGPQEAPAGRAPPNTATPAGALEEPCTLILAPPPNVHLEVIDHIHEIFHFARKLMTHQPRFELDEKRFLAEIEHPLFVIEDGSLQRREA